MTGTKNVVFYRYKVEIHPGLNGKVPTGRKARQIVHLALEHECGPMISQIATDYK